MNLPKGSTEIWRFSGQKAVRFVLSEPVWLFTTLGLQPTALEADGPPMAGQKEEARALGNGSLHRRFKEKLSVPCKAPQNTPLPAQQGLKPHRAPRVSPRLPQCLCEKLCPPPAGKNVLEMALGRTATT